MEPIQGLCKLNVLSILEKLKQVPMENRTAESLYLPGYERILKYFQKSPMPSSSIEEKEFRAQLVGSWLPRCFRTYGKTPEPRVFRECSVEDIHTIINWMHSLSGATKMLHFSSPCDWPIFDRTVFSSFSEPTITYDAEGYKLFTCALRNLIECAYKDEEVCSNYLNGLKEIQTIVHVGTEKPTYMRSLELALYLIGREVEKR